MMLIVGMVIGFFGGLILMYGLLYCKCTGFDDSAAGCARTRVKDVQSMSFFRSYAQANIKTSQA